MDLLDVSFFFQQVGRFNWVYVNTGVAEGLPGQTASHVALTAHRQPSGTLSQFHWPASSCESASNNFSS